MICGLRHELTDLKAPFLEAGVIPACRACQGLVKTATISFGQPMPEAAMERARAATLACDLFLVLGSSLVVYPAAGFPLLAKQNGARLVIVNREPTDQDPGGPGSARGDRAGDGRRGLGHIRLRAQPVQISVRSASAASVSRRRSASLIASSPVR